MTLRIAVFRLVLLPIFFLLTISSAAAKSLPFQEAPMLAEKVSTGQLPPLTERLPARPKVATFDRPDQKPGLYGGTLNILMGRPSEVRLMVVYGYARLMRYDRKFELEADILDRVEVENGRSFRLHLRAGHKWSDGEPFTAEDFRYYWEDVANNPDLSPVGPPTVFKVDGELPRFKVIDRQTVEYSWSKANPHFLAALAQSRPIFIYRPAHYLRQFHANYSDRDALDAAATKQGLRNWAGLHNRHDNPYRFDNPDLPTLQPWLNTTHPPANRFVLRRNPYYHRIDPEGRQLPYIDEVVMTIADKRLIPAKAAAGESDLQARYLRFDNVPLLKSGAARSGYEVHIWRVGKGAHLALYPNLNTNDPAWRDLIRDVRFRRALSLAIDREEINKTLFYGLAMPVQNTVLPDSPMFRREYQAAWTEFDLDAANDLLDEIGLDVRDGRGIRLMPDGRPIEIIIDTAGENTEEPDVLQLISESWKKVGIRLHTRPSHRDVLRNRIYSGDAIMSISSGLENGMPTAESSPDELAPTRQVQYQWPKWGQNTETGGQAGSPIDMPTAKQLLGLLEEWEDAPTRKDRARIWHEMLAIHSRQLYVIGLIAGTLQPITVSNRLRNVPERGIYNWEPGAHFGVYQPDTFWLVPEVGSL